MPVVQRHTAKVIINLSGPASRVWTTEAIEVERGPERPMTQVRAPFQAKGQVRQRVHLASGQTVMATWNSHAAGRMYGL
jgi:hypothetical protein